MIAPGARTSGGVLRRAAAVNRARAAPRAGICAAWRFSSGAARRHACSERVPAFARSSTPDGAPTSTASPLRSPRLGVSGPRSRRAVVSASACRYRGDSRQAAPRERSSSSVSAQFTRVAGWRAPGDSHARARGFGRRLGPLVWAHCRGQPSRAAPASSFSAAPGAAAALTARVSRRFCGLVVRHPSWDGRCGLSPHLAVNRWDRTCGDDHRPRSC
jgi:hypothetical protein